MNRQVTLNNTMNLSFQVIELDFYQSGIEISQNGSGGIGSSLEKATAVCYHT
jgi:hypothetical protein